MRKIKDLIGKYYKKKPLISFIIIAILCISIFQILLLPIIEKIIFPEYLYFLSDFSTYFLHLIDSNYLNINEKIYFGETYLVDIHPTCSGIGHFAIFISFVIAYPIKTKHKIWLSIIGLSTIFILNMVRLVSLTIILKHYGIFIFNILHIHIFPYFIYLTLLILVIWWIKRFSNPIQKQP